MHIHWTPVELITDAIAAGSVSTPIWMVPEDALHLHLQIASLTLGCLWIALRIVMLVSSGIRSWRRNRRR